VTATETSDDGRRVTHDKVHVLQSPGDHCKNGILACMLQRDVDGLKRSAEFVRVNERQVLLAPGETATHVLFPVGAVVSLAAVVNGSARMHMASVGCEGMVGVHVFMGGASTCSCAVVQRGGILIRLPTLKLKSLFDRGGACQNLFLRYAHSLLGEMSQLAACNRFHSLHQRLCRWLLLNHDITPDMEILQSQDSMSDALGVRREGVTAAAGRLRHEGSIHYSRGHITILNRAMLEAGACECYGRLRKERSRLLPRNVAT
jgi:CRP-like cAMP-binding protein